MTAADYRRMAAEAERSEGDQTLESVCALVGVGARAVQSRERSADLSKRRAVVAWILHDRLKWPQARVAAALKRTPRQVRSLVANERG